MAMSPEGTPEEGASHLVPGWSASLPQNAITGMACPWCYRADDTRYAETALVLEAIAPAPHSSRGSPSDRRLCEHVFDMVPPYPVVRRRLDRALAARDLEGVRAAARELPGRLGLTDALAVVVVMEELEDPRFERAAARFVGRFAAECGGVGLGEIGAALEALDALPAPDAHATLVALLKRHGG